MSASLGLYRLQRVDRQIDIVQSQLDHIRMKLENDEELRVAFSQVEAAETEKKQARQFLQEAEHEEKSQQIKIEQAEASLYGGQVHNPKELQDLQNDVDSLKRRLASLEERELETMLRMETAENQLGQARSNLEKIQSSLGNLHQTLFSERAILTKDLERLMVERSASLNAVAAGLLQQYENLRKNHRGLAVAEIGDNSCSACGATLTAALQQNARSSSQVVPCPSCGRILYAA